MTILNTNNTRNCSIVVGALDIPREWANIEYNKTNSAAAITWETNLDSVIDAFMMAISLSIQGAETNGLHFGETAKKCSASESAISLPGIRPGQTDRHIEMQEVRYRLERI